MAKYEIEIEAATTIIVDAASEAEAESKGWEMAPLLRDQAGIFAPIGPTGFVRLVEPEEAA